ncbi:energy transducer TonB [Colwellia polaris]|jgi:protein TonB|uniref:energy transducer TonB n=1 Tax=Colwellia polaris TaxID=326537 RepID=UPI000A16E930|nr:energy transducer TonB [Colwellia polaris]|tara:strand:+ start:4696 stop:5316 length:621 start_codon:yes stop_codon:yes gene_type:complete
MGTNLVRYAISLVLAVMVTIALLWSMQRLIAGGNDVLSEPPRGNVLDFIRLKQDETVQKKERKPQKPPTPKEPPPQMQQPQMQQANPNTNAVSTSFTADVQTDSGLSGGLNLESADGDYLPIVKVAPIYPRRAQSRGIEGYVIVEFTVTKNGSVRNPLVIESQPEGIFDRAAMDAALKFKYKPRVVDGVATEVAGVQNKISFEIDG